MSARTGDPVKSVVPKSCMASRRIGTQLGGANRQQSSVGNLSGLASCQVCETGSGHCGESSMHLRKFRVGTLNVNTLRGRVCEVVETLSRRKVDVCCIQETRYRSGNCRTIKGKDTRYKLYWSGNDKGTAGVGVFVAEEWIETVSEVQRVADRIILVKLIVGQRVVTFCLCMPHRVQASFHAPSVALEWAATASSAMAASTGCTRNAVGSSA